jgi:RND family efflux transporter MFP subunit
MDLVAPVLTVRRSDDRVLPLRAWDSTLKAGRWLVGPKHTVWKLAGLAVVAAMLFVTFYHTTYRIGAVAELRARDRRVVSVPFDGVLKERAPGIEAGVTVKAGQVLALLDDTELQLQAAEVQARLVQAEKALAQAMREQKTAEARKAEAQAEEARAQLDLLNSRIVRARITSPIDGTIISGELRERIGGSVKLGDELFQIATLDDMLAVARVDERDIALIKPGSPGQLATKSLPAVKFPVKVVTVVPLAEPKDGKNIFEVRVQLDQSAEWMRPGMEGLIRLDAGERSLLAIGLRRVVDTVRLWLW